MLQLKSTLLFLIIGSSCLSQNEISIGQKTRRISEFFDNYHLKSRAIDDDFSERLYLNLLLNIDEDKTLFSREDVQTLNEASKAFPTDIEKRNE